MKAKNSRKKILVIEDNIVVASMIQFILSNEGFEVIIAHDPDEAVELFVEHEPDLVISDVMLPHLDGFTLTNILRRMSDIPVIVLTALAGAQHRRQGLASGACDYITKPFDPKDLVRRIRGVLERS